MRKFLNIFDSLSRIAAELTFFAIFIAGLAVLSSGVGYAFFIPSNILAIPLASISSIIGTAICSFSLIKLSEIKAKERAEELLQEKTRSSNLQAAIKQLKDLENQRADLEKQVQRLSSSRIDVQSISPILKLSLLEVDSIVKDVFHKVIHREAPGHVQRGESHEYLGVVETSFKASLGVDLNLVRIHEDTSGKIIISGLMSEFQGLRNLSENWIIKEIRVQKFGGMLPNAFDIIPNDSRLANLTIEQRDSVQKRLNAGIEFKNMDGHIKLFAQKVLELLLKPTGKAIQFSDQHPNNGIGILDYLRKHNQSIDTEMNQLAVDIQTISSKAQILRDPPSKLAIQSDTRN